MRFTPHWDSTLLSLHSSALPLSPRPVLTTYPPPYHGAGPSATLPSDASDCCVVLCARHVAESDGLLRIVGRRLLRPPSSSPPHPPPRSLFWAAGFAFSHSRVVTEVGAVG